MILWTIKPIVYWVCPICRWRGKHRNEIRDHMKFQHGLKRNMVKLLTPNYDQRTKAKDYCRVGW